MSSLLKTAEKIFLDLLFPLSCLGCHQEGELLCEECRKTIPILATQVCPICEKTITNDGKLCKSCQETTQSPINQLVVASDYQNPLLVKLIHSYKYRFAYQLAKPLGDLMVRTIKKTNLPIPDLIIPIPLHPRRLRWRGFNQAELLANYLSENLTPGLTIPVSNDIVLRRRNTPSQMKIKNYQMRQENLKNAFELNPKHIRLLKGKKILLIDDVCTTGATLLECAQALKPAHPYSISVAVLARQS